MTGLLNTRILASIAMLVFVGAVVASSTGAFFSDTETSTGNTFTAGEIDLQIDNTSYVTNAAGVLVASPNNTWGMSNLTNQLFFSFADVKPGDIGEDTISVHAGSNNAWACMAAKITSTPENSLVDPETDAGDAGPANGDNGELQNYLNFVFWNDDGDNVYETGETQIANLTGSAGTIFNGNWAPIADLQHGTAIPGGGTRYIGKAWCFGTLTPNNTAQDNASSTNPLTNTGHTGFNCDGSGNNNNAQTDGIGVDVSFYAVQTRNNTQFLCSSLPAYQGGGNQTKVGSNFALYTPPASCTVTANVAATEDTTHSHTINGAIGLAATVSGSTVCVVPGTYNESVNVNKSITLAGTGAVGAAIINGGVDVNADNVTVKGFKVTPGAIGVGPTQASFFVEDVANNANITDNDIDGAGHPNAGGTRGVILAEGGTFSNVLIQNNSIHDFTSDIYVSTISGAGDPVTIKWNDIKVDTPADNGAGGAAGIGQLNDAVVTLNEFTSEVAGGEAIGAGPDYEASNVINFNNFLSGSKINDYTAPPTIQAPNNFFNVSAATQAPVNVTTAPVAGAQYGHR